MQKILSCKNLGGKLFTKNFFIGIRSQSSAIDLPPCDFKPEPYKGLSYEDTLKTRKQHLHPSLVTYYKSHVLMTQGYMQYLFDHTGKRYLDFFSGIVTVSVGHCHPKVNNALKQQLDLLWHTTSIYMHPGIQEYAKRLTDKMPDPLKVVYFVNSGSDANDLALMMALLYTGKSDIVSLQNGYHGMGFGAGAVTSLENWRHNLPSGISVRQAMNPDVYRGVWGGKNCRDSPAQTDRSCDCGVGECEACDRYLEQLENVVRYCTPQSGIAGFIAEPIQGVGGTVQLPRNYLKKAYEMIRNRGGLCICDEVQTGFGRTGEHFWGFEMADVVPDIVTMAKGIGNGFPMAAVVTSPEIAKSLNKALHFNTFGGNPMACAVGKAVLEVMEDEKCQDVCHDVGTYILKELQKLKSDHSVLGDVRGKGLMIGLELVKAEGCREPLPRAGVMSIQESLKENSLLLGVGGVHSNVLRIKPPMCITKEDADFAVKVIDHVLSEFETSQ